MEYSSIPQRCLWVLNVLGLLPDCNFNKGIFHILFFKMTLKALLCNEPLHPKKDWRKSRECFFVLFFLFSVFFFSGGERGRSCLLADPEPSTQKDADRFWLYCSLRVAPSLLCCVSLDNLSHLSVFPHCL